MTCDVLHYFHDPMCSWCWGYRPTRLILEEHLPEGVGWNNVLGGLAPDSDAPMPPHQQAAIKSHWQKIQSLLGTTFNFDFWTQCTPRRSTYPACRAVIAAANQNHENQMIEAIQRAYYLRAMNPSDVETLVAIADELALNPNEFATSLQSFETEQILEQQVAFARASPINGFPSLVLQLGERMMPVTLDYQDYRVSMAHIEQLRKTRV